MREVVGISGVYCQASGQVGTQVYWYVMSKVRRLVNGQVHVQVYDHVYSKVDWQVSEQVSSQFLQQVKENLTI
jgi:hypothetical protein